MVSLPGTFEITAPAYVLLALLKGKRLSLFVITSGLPNQHSFLPASLPGFYSGRAVSRC
jgi:hypothetical protein